MTVVHYFPFSFIWLLFQILINYQKLSQFGNLFLLRNLHTQISISFRVLILEVFHKKTVLYCYKICYFNSSVTIINWSFIKYLAGQLSILVLLVCGFKLKPKPQWIWPQKMTLNKKFKNNLNQKQLVFIVKVNVLKIFKKNKIWNRMLLLV